MVARQTACGMLLLFWQGFLLSASSQTNRELIERASMTYWLAYR